MESAQRIMSEQHVCKCACVWPSTPSKLLPLLPVLHTPLNTLSVVHANAGTPCGLCAERRFRLGAWQHTHTHTHTDTHTSAFIQS